jgi:hypothetical protein
MMIPRKPVPGGITFGAKVVLLPSLSSIFDRSLWIQATRHNPYALHQSHTWIDRGDPLAHVVVDTAKTGVPALDFFLGRNVHQVVVPSPVSGLMLYPNLDYGNASDRSAALLLPDDEPPAESGRFMYRALCDLCWTHREYIFYQPKELKRSGYYNDAVLDEAFKDQMSRTCAEADALPRYKDYFDEARTRYPELRPLLKHLR